MTWIGEDLGKRIRENDIKEVVFEDPLSDVTRKAKRNLVAGAFACLLIAALGLQVTSFSGLQAPTGNLGNDITRGLACIAVLYLLVSFLFHFFVDYSAWKFERERFLAGPYLELINLISSHLQIVPTQVENAFHPLKQLLSSNSSATGIDPDKITRELGQVLESIKNHLAELNTELQPLLESWSGTIASANKLSRRYKIRIAGLWLLDFLVPLLLSCIAVFKSWSGISVFLCKITG